MLESGASRNVKSNGRSNGPNSGMAAMQRELVVMVRAYVNACAA
jgi:hypothetical protein